MEQLEKEYETISRSLCRVGKITPRINAVEESRTFLINFKKSNRDLIEG